MTSSSSNLKIDEYISNARNWQEELKKLRSITLDCELTEEWKWNLPCYTFQNKNIVIIQDFKAYCALMFFKGVLLNDTREILTKPGEHSQAQRQIRFTTTQEIDEMEDIIKAYISEAIEIEKAGLEVQLKETTEYEIPVC